MLRRDIPTSEIIDPFTAYTGSVKYRKHSPVIQKSLPINRLPKGDQIHGLRQIVTAWGGQSLELIGSGAYLGSMFLKDQERKNALSLVGHCMDQLEGVAQNPITSTLGIVKFNPWYSVVAEVNELTSSHI